jgi:hypothetical protein
MKEVEARIKLPNARLYRILSKPILLTDNGMLLKQYYYRVIAESQAVRYPANHTSIQVN